MIDPTEDVRPRQVKIFIGGLVSIGAYLWLALDGASALVLLPLMWCWGFSIYLLSRRAGR